MIMQILCSWHVKCLSSKTVNFTKIYKACALNLDTYFYSPLKIEDIVSSTKFITDSLKLAFVAFNLDLFNDFR